MPVCGPLPFLWRSAFSDGRSKKYKQAKRYFPASEKEEHDLAFASQGKEAGAAREKRQIKTSAVSAATITPRVLISSSGRTSGDILFPFVEDLLCVPSASTPGSPGVV